MNHFKYFSTLLSAFIVMTSFSQCSSAKKLEKSSPIETGNVYCQAWTGGTQQAGSGIDIFIPVSKVTKASIELDSVYFRGKVAKLEQKVFNDSLIYIGRFRSKPAKDIIISNDPKEEYKNTLEIKKEIPFDLQDDACVVSYNANGKTKYFKIENILEKPRNNYPSMRSN